MKKIKNYFLFAYISFIVLNQLCALGLLLTMLSDDRLFVLPEKQAMSDFVELYAAGRIASSPDSKQSYDAAVQNRWFDRLIGAKKMEKPQYIQYVPMMFALMTLLAWLPMTQAYLVWCVSTFALGLTGLAKVIDWQGDLKRKLNRKKILLYVAVLASSMPAWFSLRIGQVTWLILAIQCLFAWAWLTKHDRIAGIALALNTLKPQYCLLLLIPPLSRKRWLVLISAAVSELLLIGWAGCVLGTKQLLDYPRVLLSAETSRQVIGVRPDLMVSLRGLLTILGLDQHLIMLLSMLVLAAAGVWLFFVWRQASNEGDQRWALAVTVMASLVVSLHTHSFDCLLVALAAALTVPELIGKLTAQPLSVKLWSILMIAYPGLTWFFFLLPMPQINVNVVIAVTNILLLALGAKIVSRKSVV